jgi:hypothetical protein
MAKATTKTQRLKERKNLYALCAFVVVLYPGVCEEKG